MHSFGRFNLRKDVYYAEESWEELRKKWDELQRRNK
jgi:hypothetical protein